MLHPSPTALTTSPSSYTTSYFVLKHTFMRVYVGIYVCVCVYIYIYIHTHTHIYIYIYMSIYVDVSSFSARAHHLSIVIHNVVFCSAGMCVRMYISMCVLLYMYACMYMHICLQWLWRLATPQYSSRSPLLTHLPALHTRPRRKCRSLHYLRHEIPAPINRQGCFTQSVEPGKQHLCFTSRLAAGYWC